MNTQNTKMFIESRLDRINDLLLSSIAIDDGIAIEIQDEIDSIKTILQPIYKMSRRKKEE